jgi:hypothetical protein
MLRASRSGLRSEVDAAEIEPAQDFNRPRVLFVFTRPGIQTEDDHRF